MQSGGEALIRQRRPRGRPEGQSNGGKPPPQAGAECSNLKRQLSGDEIAAAAALEQPGGSRETSGVSRPQSRMGMTT